MKTHLTRATTLVLSFCLAIATLAVPIESVSAQSCASPYPSPHLRFGINVALDGGKTIADYNSGILNLGWYHDYSKHSQPLRPNGIRYDQMLRTGANLDANLDQIIANNPGSVWIVGNEPDRFGQDGVIPSVYATYYHDAYVFIKGRDPTAKVSFGGLLQPTPLRLHYLDLVMQSYQSQYGTSPPADLIHVHNFVLRESTDWGAGYPPGITDQALINSLRREYSIADHGDINIFKQQLRDFRQWMNDNGYRNKPLIINEYGILLPPPFGYNDTVVGNFMTATFDFFLNETDAGTGYPADNNRLTQEWAWFSLNYYEYDSSTGIGLAGNLFNRDSGAIKPLGTTFANYTAALKVSFIDLGLNDIGLTPGTTVNQNSQLTIDLTVRNAGSVLAENVVVQLYDGDPAAGGQLLANSSTIGGVRPACDESVPVQLIWNVGNQPTGPLTLYLHVQASNGNLESNPGDNLLTQPVTIQAGASSGPPVTIGVNGNVVDLSWSNPVAFTSIEVHRSATPFFTPGAATLMATLPGSATAYQDTRSAVSAAGGGGTLEDVYYTVRGIEGATITDFTQVGVVDYPLNNSGGKYSMVTVPFAGSGISSAADLAAQVGNVGAMLKWNPATQTFRFFVPPSTGDNFSLAAGDAVFLLLNAGGPAVTTFWGNVVATSHNLVTNGYNFISLPMQQDGLSDIAGVSATIGPVNAALRWNEATQTFRFFVPPSTGDNFNLAPGDPFIVQLGASGGGVWP